jgi:septal ring factor EnvC (AmiA/AmiB activator)
MANPKDNDTTLSGWQKFFFEIGRTFGVPTLILLIGLYLVGWVLAPPMVDTMKRFFDATINTQQVMAQTQESIASSQEDLADSQAQLVDVCREISATTARIMECEESSSVFMHDVRAHQDWEKGKLDTIEAAVTQKADGN